MKPFKGLSIKLDESVDNFLKCIRIAEKEIIDKKVDKEIFKHPKPERVLKGFFSVSSFCNN